ncbi:MAG: 3-phosphoshikimate 1-carboxyvinyltransferase [Deltaproteobacteria bacterium]|nr:3-phosphoshikimate 1-carboxyvinyltransferase [Deltaproteobacteria bacterium]
MDRYQSTYQRHETGSERGTHKVKEIQLKPSIDATIRMPGSKSITHRALIAASLANGESLLQGFLTSKDTLYTVNALRELGVKISIAGENITISGSGGKFPVAADRKEIFLGNSGTSYRFLLSTVALARGEYILTGVPRMYERPIGDLVTALKKLGAEVTYIEKDNFPPLFIRAKGIHGGKVQIPVSKSSQYVSSLLLAGPYAKKNLEIEITGRLVSRPYVDITLDVMEKFGVHVDRDRYSFFKVPAGYGYLPRQFSIEGDVSAASYFWAAAAVTGGIAITENIKPYTTRQGDIAFLDVLEEMGCCVERENDRVSVHGGVLSGVEVDMGAMPDMAPTLAAIALFAEGKTAIRNVSHLRHKESNRLKAIAVEWSRIGSRVEELADGLIIYGGKGLMGEKGFQERRWNPIMIIGWP